MAETGSKATGPDLTEGIAETDLAADAMLGGHVGEEAVVLARAEGEVFAIGGKCTHYGGPLAEGLLVGTEIRCPWHHTCFSLRTGEALKAPAIDPVPRWRVERRDGKLFVREQIEAPRPATGVRETEIGEPERIVIIGGGAAGFAAAEMLRRQGYAGSLTMVSDDSSPPCDRPNLSKDYLAGKAPESWIPLRDPAFYREHSIDLRLDTQVAGIDAADRMIGLADGSRLPYDRLLLATGSEPRRLDVPGADRAHVHVLRSLSDCRSIIAGAETSRNAVVVGASFIGLEVAASLRTRGLAVHVVAPDERPLGNVLGPELGDFIKAYHEEHGVVFHLGDTLSEIGPNSVRTRNGLTLDAGLVVVGIGVRPRTELAERAGLAVDNGVLVDAFLETSTSGIFAAGDIARWPDRRAGERIRIEHWVVAERQGQCVAFNMLGRRRVFDEVPFFWSQHYDLPINYVGYAPKWDRLAIDGKIAAHDCAVRFMHDRRTVALATIYRDKASLEAERDMELEAAKP